MGDPVISSMLAWDALAPARALRDKERGQALNAFIARYSQRTGVAWALEGTYLTRLGNYKAVIVASMGRRKVLRWSQDRWKQSD